MTSLALVFAKHKDKKFRPDPFESSTVAMTDDDWNKFVSRVGSFEAAVYWTERAESYAEDRPKKWASYKCHYRTLTNWHREKLESGRRWYKHPETGAGYYPNWEIERLERAAKR